MAYVSQEDKKKLAPAINAVLRKYRMKGTISVRHHSALVVKLKSGAIDFSDYLHGDGYAQVNEFYIDQHYSGIQREFLTELLEAMKGPDFFDHSDSMSDYFHRSHYTDISIGTWEKPYKLALKHPSHYNTARKTSQPYQSIEV